MRNQEHPTIQKRGRRPHGGSQAQAAEKTKKAATQASLRSFLRVVELPRFFPTRKKISARIARNDRLLQRGTLEEVAGLGELEVGDAVAEEALLGEFLDEDDLGGDEDGGLAGCVGNGDFDEGAIVVTLVAFEAQAAFGHVFADDDVIAAVGMVDAGGVTDLDANVLAAIDARMRRFLRGRNGEDGGSRLTERLRVGGGIR